MDSLDVIRGTNMRGKRIDDSEGTNMQSSEIRASMPQGAVDREWIVSHVHVTGF
jgi:hypothetical protein